MASPICLTRFGISSRALLRALLECAGLVIVDSIRKMCLSFTRWKVSKTGLRSPGLTVGLLLGGAVKDATDSNKSSAFASAVNASSDPSSGRK